MILIAVAPCGHFAESSQCAVHIPPNFLFPSLVRKNLPRTTFLLRSVTKCLRQIWFSTASMFSSHTDRPVFLLLDEFGALLKLNPIHSCLFPLLFLLHWTMSDWCTEVSRFNPHHSLENQHVQ